MKQNRERILNVFNIKKQSLLKDIAVFSLIGKIHYVYICQTLHVI
jgi:hypothetical protein